jgi:hypothetical protein
MINETNQIVCWIIQLEREDAHGLFNRIGPISSVCPALSSTAKLTDTPTGVASRNPISDYYSENQGRTPEVAHAPGGKLMVTVGEVESNPANTCSWRIESPVVRILWNIPSKSEAKQHLKSKLTRACRESLLRATR